jgi:hypothetical protein
MLNGSAAAVLTPFPYCRIMFLWQRKGPAEKQPVRKNLKALRRL